ncbi:MAG TPA: flagellar biosynthesis protein FlhB [Phycisphaerae bacterium]|nr:flagellar biosynthesis protein FlhB [Phycisphaerae bacterium]HNU46171.1 flagellar biosynthesis protein FlhB [Phycisphaerae bacterium]
MPADYDAKTEPPTPRRRREAREGGNVARSQDLPAAVTLLVGLVALDWFGPRLMRTLLGAVQTSLAAAMPPARHSLVAETLRLGVEALKAVAPFLLLIVVAVLVTQVAQVGGVFTTRPLMPNLGKLNPINGLKRMFSGRTLAAAVINLGKLFLVGVVAYLTLVGSAAEVLYAFTVGFPEALGLGAALTFRLGIRLAAVLLILGLADYAYQRYRHERDLRMTKEEVKDEYRSMEGDPQIKRRRRQLQFQLAMHRIKAGVKKADVVVTNPTELAIAISYDPDTMYAPKVVAKGAGYLAERIRRLAVDFAVPIVQRRALARAMYEAVEVGEYIPERFYQAIAEILAYVYELSGRAREFSRTAAVGAG